MSGNIEALTRDNIEQQFSDIERRLLMPHSGTIGWMGIWVSWERGAKRDGCTVKRGKAYGRFKYAMFSTGKELTREQAIAEILKPPGLRQAAHDLTYVWECVICGDTIIGQEAYMKGHHFTYRGKDIGICEECLDCIAEGRVHHG